jgi:hypothetical protein
MEWNGMGWDGIEWNRMEGNVKVARDQDSTFNSNAVAAI